MSNTNTNAKHTPGPWVADSSGKYFRHPVVRMNGVVVASQPPQTTITTAEAEANARLIAASPNMLAVIERLLKEDADGEFTIGLIEDAQAVLAAVRGGL